MQIVQPFRGRSTSHAGEVDRSLAWRTMLNFTKTSISSPWSCKYGRPVNSFAPQGRGSGTNGLRPCVWPRTASRPCSVDFELSAVKSAETPIALQPAAPRHANRFNAQRPRSSNRFVRPTSARRRKARFRRGLAAPRRRESCPALDLLRGLCNGADRLFTVRSTSRCARSRSRVRRMIQRLDQLLNRIRILAARRRLHVVLRVRHLPEPAAFTFCSQPLKPQSVT